MDTAERVVETLFRLLTRDNAWPIWETVDYELDTVLGLNDPWDAVRAVDRKLLWGIGDWEPDDRQQVGLTITGLATCDAAREDLAIFVASVRFAADRAQDLKPPADVTLTPQDLVQNIQLPSAGRADLLTRQHALWQTVSGLWTGLSHPTSDHGWSVQLKRKTLRRFRGVESVRDYLEVMQSDMKERDADQIATTRNAHTIVQTLDFSGQQPNEGAGPDSERFESITADSGAVYKLYRHERLGNGGQGVVYAGVDADDQPVAIKLVSLRSFDTEKWYRDARYAEREALVNLSLEGRNLHYVMPLLDYVLENDAFILIYPRASMSLGDVVRSVADERGERQLASAPNRMSVLEHFGGPVPNVEQVQDLSTELARGLVELHEHGVLHRDVKPDNALHYQDRWVWGDLGTARLTESATSTYTWRDIGTDAYRAPEVMMGEPATQRSDVYALGCSVYALITGRPPFGDEGNIRGREVADLSIISDDNLRHVIGYMLNSRPGARPTAEQVVTMLTDAPMGPGANALRRIGIAANRRSSERSAADARMAERHEAAEDALMQFDQLWHRFTKHVQKLLPDARPQRDQGAWLLAAGDRRLVVKIAEPGSAACPAVQLGTVTVEAEGSLHTSEVANVCALVGDDRVPSWRLLRMARNDLAPRKARVSEALSDELGAVNFQSLEDYLRERSQRVFAPSASARDEQALTVENLAELFAAEVEAIDARLDNEREA